MGVGDIDVAAGIVDGQKQDIQAKAETTTRNTGGGWGWGAVPRFKVFPGRGVKDVDG